jgi:Transposase IS116/IS110/IS902 family
VDRRPAAAAPDERLTVDGGLRQLDFLTGELARVGAIIAEHALGDDDVRRLMTIPGIDVVTAPTLAAVIGDVRRFPTAGHLVGYLGLHPTIRQSGNGPARHGRTSEAGPAAARHVLVEVAWSAAKSPRPLRAFAQRTAARRGRHVATVAVARKLAVLAWNLLTRGEDTPSHARASCAASCAPSSSRPAHRAPSPAPTPPRPGTPPPTPPRSTSPSRPRSPIDGWQASGPKAGAGATPERASQRPSKGKAARQAAKLLTPALRHVSHPHPHRSLPQGARTRHAV